MELTTEAALLGGCLLAAQKVEFILYGIASHLSHLPEAKERRFRELTPEIFMRSDPKELKATLGQIEKVFGERLLIASSELQDFIDQRNLIVHNYYRMTRKSIRDAKQINDPESFLNSFLYQCGYWEKVLSGLLQLMRVSSAQKENRCNEVNLNEYEQQCVQAYYAHAGSRLTSRGSG